MSSNCKLLPPGSLKKSLPILLLAVLLLAPTQGNADTIYTSLGAYNAATTGNTTIDFNGIAAPGSFVNFPGPLTLSGVTFSTTSALFVIDPGFYGSPYAGGGFLNADFVSPDVINITLPSVTAVGFDFGGLFIGPTASVAVTLSDGFSTNFSTTNSMAGGTLDFLGFTTTTPITSMTLTMSDAPGYNAIDNVVYGSAVPEPATIGLMLTGLLGAAGAVRRRLQS
jgi:hypothetical protein